MKNEDVLAYKHAAAQAREQARAMMEAERARIGRPRVRMANSGDPKKVIWPTVDEYMAGAKESGVSPEDLEKLKATYSELLEQVKNGDAEIEILSTDSEGRVTAAGMTSSSIRASRKGRKAVRGVLWHH